VVGLGRFFANDGIRADGKPGLRHALEAAQGLVRHTREDLQEEVIGETGHRMLLS